MSQLRYLITQSLNVFGDYGKGQQEVTDILKAFVMVLDEQPIQAINKAFEIWMKEKSKFPAPADILSLCKEYKPEREERFLSYLEFDKGWLEYKKYLKERGLLHPELSTKPKDHKHNYTNNNPVPWAFKLWGDFTDDDKLALAEHMKSFDTEEDYHNYKKYLIHWAKVPPSWFG